jgi:hypothetical protein
MKFTDLATFEGGWRKFWVQAEAGEFSPRDYVLDNLTLEKQARAYYEIAQGIMQRQPG